MYSVILKIDNQEYSIHDDKNKLTSGSVKQGVNTIDSFSFTILPNNIGFNLIKDFKTLISVYNEKRKKYEFQGRVLYSSNSMENNGRISKTVVCEDFLGYLQDSVQEYIYEQNWTPTELLTQLLSVHNSQLEEEKHFQVGNVFSDENIYIGIQRETTWNMIDEKIIKKIGGEIQLRIVDGVKYIDIVKERGTTKATTIELSKNMLSITKESDPSSYITRLIPLGGKIKDDEGNDTEDRIDITSVNDGLNYIDDVTAIEHFGLHVAYEYWDDVNEPEILKSRGINFLKENNKILQKYKISTLDLATINIDIDYIDACNYYPIKNKLLGIDEVLRVITKTIDVVNEQSTNIEIGDNFKTLSDLEVEKDKQIKEAVNTIKIIENDYVTNQAVSNITNELYSYIGQTESNIKTDVSKTYTNKSEFEEYQATVSTIFEQTNNSFQMTFSDIVKQITDVNGTVNSNYTELIKYIRFKGGTITLGEVNNPLVLTLSNDRLSFKQNGVEVAYVSDSKMYIYDGEFLNSLKIGRWVFIPRSNENLSFTYV